MTLSRRGAGCNRHICLSKSSQSCRSMSHPSDTASRLSELRAIVYRSIIPAGRKTHERVNWSLRLTTRAFSVVARWFLKKGSYPFSPHARFRLFFRRPPAGPAASRATEPTRRPGRVSRVATEPNKQRSPLRMVAPPWRLGDRDHGRTGTVRHS
jgi:hypothetical protein